MGSNTVLAELSFRHAFYIVLVVRVVDIRLAWLVYFRTYSVPFLNFGSKQAITKTLFGRRPNQKQAASEKSYDNIKFFFQVKAN